MRSRLAEFHNIQPKSIVSFGNKLMCSSLLSFQLNTIFPCANSQQMTIWHLPDDAGISTEDLFLLFKRKRLKESQLGILPTGAGPTQSEMGRGQRNATMLPERQPKVQTWRIVHPLVKTQRRWAWFYKVCAQQIMWRVARVSCWSGN